MKSILFLKKNRIKKKFFKKNIFLLNNIKFEKVKNLKLNISSNLYKKYCVIGCQKTGRLSQNRILIKDTLIINISQKLFNNKSTIIHTKNLCTFSIGSILKYFKIKQGKYVRRSLKGVKIFLNFLKNFLSKNFLSKNNFKNLILHINGFDYNLFFLKKNLKDFFLKKKGNFFFLLNLKITFTKTKDKKVKAIKKRLRKKILLNFIKIHKIKK